MEDRNPSVLSAAVDAAALLATAPVTMHYAGRGRVPWFGRPQPRRVMGARPFHPTYKKTVKGLVKVAQDGYVFDKIGNIRSKKRIATQFEGLKKYKLRPWNGKLKPSSRRILPA